MVHIASNVQLAERRKHWRDRRSGLDRRNTLRNQQESFDCRSGAPRRRSDVAGETYDGDVWWDDGRH